LIGTPSPKEGVGRRYRKPVGMVTAPYRGQAHGRRSENPDPSIGSFSQVPESGPGAPISPTLGSRLEALGIATDFFPGVLVALKLDGELRFGLGSTLAVSRPALDAIGGFAPLADSLADDYELGHRIAKAGFAVALSSEIVETSVPAYTLGGFFSHQLRWARSIRDSRKAGYLGLVFTFGLPWAIFNSVASGFALESLALLSLTCLARVTVALAVGVGILGDRQVLRDLWLLPLRDLAALWVWVWSFAGNTVTWRGETFTLENGNLKPVASETRSDSRSV
jgi:ceramide glucosyltransferase